MKAKFDIKDFIGTCSAIHCETKKEAQSIINLIAETGFEIRPGLFEASWSMHPTEICYVLIGSRLTFSSLAYTEAGSYRLFTASDFLEEEITSEDKVKYAQELNFEDFKKSKIMELDEAEFMDSSICEKIMSSLLKDRKSNKNNSYKMMIFSIPKSFNNAFYNNLTKK